MINDVVKDLQASFEKTMESLKRDLTKVRTGRASLTLLDGVKVEYYGTMTPLSQVSTMNVPDPRLITVKPWEKSLIPVIERAIKAQSDLSLNPICDGDLIRLPIPPLTQDRRKELVKVIKKMSEEAKVALRNARRESNEMVKELEDGGEITEDDSKQGLKKVQDVTDKYVATIDEILEKKEKEILEI